MKTILSCMNYDHTSQRGEVVDPVSIVMPDQSMSMREILDKFSRGIPFSLHNYSSKIFDEDDMNPDPNTMDLADRQEYLEAVETALDNLKNKQDEKVTRPDNSETSQANGPA